MARKKRESLPIPKVKEFQISSSWAPVTPEKHILSKTQPICEEREENQLGFSRETQAHGTQGYCDSSNCIDTTKNFEHWEPGLAGKPRVSSNFLMGSGRLTRASLRALAVAPAISTLSVNASRPGDFDPTSSQFPCIFNSRFEGNHEIEANSGCSQLANQAVSIGSNLWNNSSCAPDTSPYGNSIPSQPNYVLNSPARALTDAFSRRNISHFAPITPDQSKKAEENKLACDMRNFSVDEVTDWERDKQGNELPVTRVEVNEHQSCEKEQQQVSKDLLSVAGSTELAENHNPDKGSNTGIDLNRTPQEKQRRKKHRPKVVIEGRPKRTPKPVTPKPAQENPTGKRKYVRRNKVEKPSGTIATEVTSRSTDPKTAPSTEKSCRRTLNFDVECPLREESFLCRRGSNESTESQAQNFCAGFESKSTVQLGQEIEVMVERTPVDMPYELRPSMTKVLEDYVTMAERQGPRPPCPTETSQPHEKMKARAQNEHTREFSDEHTWLKDNLHVFFFDEIPDNQESTRQMTMNSHIQSAPRSPNDSNCSSSVRLTEEEQARGLKRRYPYTINGAEPSHTNMLGGHYNSLQEYRALLPANTYIYQRFPGMHFPAIHKKTRTEKFQISTTSSTLCPLNDAYEAPHTLETNCRFPGAQFNTSSTSTASLTGAQCKEQTSERKLALDQKGKTRKKRSDGPTWVPKFPSPMEVPLPTFLAQEAPFSSDLQVREIVHRAHTCTEAQVAHTPPTKTTKKWTKKNTFASSVITDATKKRIPSIDEIVEYIKCLDINRETTQVRYEEQGAIVPYQRDGTIVLFDGPFNPVRKRRPRAKVDLDEETNKVWKLLLESINNEGIDGTDEEKAKWWEEERRVFRGRADSFIARMHLVQGDRRFSPWKGSVVDSVIGVFLTQNVSDHLSSSAFMSLAAHFPLKSKSNDIPYFEEVMNSNELLGSSSGSVKSTDKSKCESPDNFRNGLEMYNQSAANGMAFQLPVAVASHVGDKTEWDDVVSSQNSAVSSQNSVDSSMAQTAEQIGSFLQDNSEIYPETMSNPNGLFSSSFVELLQRAETFPRLQNHELRNASSYKENQNDSKSWLKMTSESGVLEDESFAMLGEESPFSDICKKNEENCISEQSGVTADSVNQAMAEKVMTVSFQNTLKSPGEDDHACSSLQGKVNKIFETRNGLVENTNDNIQSETHEQNTNNTPGSNPQSSKHNTFESSLKDHEYLPGKAINGMGSDTTKVKRQRIVKQKQDTFEWDNLRMQALAKGKRDRTINTMDSLDYEAVRCADVHEIANTIKERGMNNVLAERIKDFLNRMVREHGSIDLEWLRDVPPDKAKEYLLSVRGLGLKSVECVRLLTLHHLAFPVDTNVGRIAVRLGWVPLQPLPESLQLHLLELYPVLESIQRYLWPRLCKLDQRTLYELHYQMITFGKVFCTKSKPNCNACPMRGECRHFASAFASARLALPGPEEKSIVIATENKRADQIPMDVVKPFQLLLPQDDQQLQAQSQVNCCEPVIEVPTTPEPTIEVPATPDSEQPQVPYSDIEDAMFGDPDEIPTIKLNVEELTQNLQSYVQQNMELQEANMSKALVSLTSEAASIPMPKLKNVSRLRTEHRVYELPDSHPLLEGLDKREPDDPCSYLLAIWTPGETANSIQLPESRCGFQEFGKLCGETTCFSCNSIREANSQTVRGTILIPCRTAMRGSFPLNGTYFQVNEVFADHESSLNPIDVPRAWIWNLRRRTVYFGTSIPSIFKGLSTENIQYCFWRGFVCVRGFDHKTRAPRPLMARLHFPASKLTKTKGKPDEKRE